jgi:transposase
MRQIKTILQLYHVGGIESRRQIARAVGAGKTAVADCLRRAQAAGLTSWEAIEPLDEDALERQLYCVSAGKAPRERPLPDWVRIREELARRDHQVTLALLWQEYKSTHPDGYQYPQFTVLYRAFEKKLSVVLRQHYRGGERAFVDYCDGMAITDPLTGEKIPTQLFVGALGASSYTFAHVSLSQTLPEWLDAHARMYTFFGGVSAITTCDNLAAGVTRADRYEARVNASYAELASHFGTCIIPARVRKPRDKAKAEAAVLVAQRWILAVLRHRTFYSVNEVNEAMAPLLTKLNDRVMRHVKASRRELYERLDKPALKPLPATPYEFAEWKQVRVNIDYHIVYDDHFYSAPYTLVGETLFVRATHSAIELVFKGKRLASHPRSYQKYHYTTDPAHRPASHRRYLEWTPSRLIDWGKTIGSHTGALIEYVIAHKPHPEQGYRSALGILRLAKKFGTTRLERAAERALAIQSPSYTTVKTMLARRMEAAPIADGNETRTPGTPALGTANVRGRNYYH